VLLDGRAQALGGRGRGLSAREAPDHQELLAAPSRDRVGRAAHAAQHVRHLHEHAIAGIVPELIVDRLEVVDVDHHEHDVALARRPRFVGHAMLARGRGRVGLDRLQHVAPIAQAGERVRHAETLGDARGLDPTTIEAVAEETQQRRAGDRGVALIAALIEQQRIHESMSAADV
jgi:hypothetical protein